MLVGTGTITRPICSSSLAAHCRRRVASLGPWRRPTSAAPTSPDRARDAWRLPSGVLRIVGHDFELISADLKRPQKANHEQRIPRLPRPPASGPRWHDARQRCDADIVFLPNQVSLVDRSQPHVQRSACRSSPVDAVHDLLLQLRPKHGSWLAGPDASVGSLPDTATQRVPQCAACMRPIPALPAPAPAATSKCCTHGPVGAREHGHPC